MLGHWGCHYDDAEHLRQMARLTGDRNEPDRWLAMVRLDHREQWLHDMVQKHRPHYFGGNANKLDWSGFAYLRNSYFPEDWALRMAGLEYSLPESTLTVCDSMPEAWDFMELRIPLKVDGHVRWPRVTYRRATKDYMVRKTIAVSGNPLTHLRIQPWLEGGAVFSAPKGFCRRHQGRNHIGYSVRDTADTAVTVTIKK